MKDTGKSSSRKLRRVVYYLLYRMDPQKTHYKICFSAKMSTIENSLFFLIYFPLTPDQSVSQSVIQSVSHSVSQPPLTPIGSGRDLHMGSGPGPTSPPPTPIGRGWRPPHGYAGCTTAALCYTGAAVCCTGVVRKSRHEPI